VNHLSLFYCPWGTDGALTCNNSQQNHSGFSYFEFDFIAADSRDKKYKNAPQVPLSFSGDAP
jgi:hypothetical protein